MCNPPHSSEQLSYHLLHRRPHTLRQIPLRILQLMHIRHLVNFLELPRDEEPENRE